MRKDFLRYYWRPDLPSIGNLPSIANLPRPRFLDGAKQRPASLFQLSGALFPCASASFGAIVLAFVSSHNQRMRTLAGLVVVVAIACGLYFFTLKKMPVTDQGTAPTQAISLTGVRMDLLSIAQAERSFIAQNGRCASVEELISSGSLAVTRPERDGYVYSADCSTADFTVTARHDPAPAGSPIRYPTLAIDSNMQVSEVN